MCVRKGRGEKKCKTEGELYLHRGRDPGSIRTKKPPDYHWVSLQFLLGDFQPLLRHLQVSSSLQPPALLTSTLFYFSYVSIFSSCFSFSKPGAVCEMLNVLCSSRLSSISCAAWVYINLSKHKHSNTAVLILHNECILSLSLSFFSKRDPGRIYRTDPSSIQTASWIKWDLFARI